MTFQREIEFHIIRVEYLGLELVRLHPKRFGDLDKKRLRMFLKLHDRQKIEPPRLNSRSTNPNDFRFFLLDLWNIRGKSLKDFEGDEYTYNRNVIDKLNESDHNKAMTFFINNGMVQPHGQHLTSSAKSFFLVEKVADVVDRGMHQNTGKEFGKKMLLASEFLTDDLERELARSLEEHYDEVIGSNAVAISNSRLKQRKHCAGAIMGIMNGSASASATAF